MKIIEFFIRQSKIINIFVLLLLGAGIYIFITGQKEAFPPFASNQAVISAVYPGASASAVEKLLAFPIEKKIRGITGIERTESVSRESVCTITATAAPGYEKDLNDIKSEIETKISEIVFPSEVETPRVTLFDNNQIPVIRVLFSGGRDEYALRKAVMDFEDNLRDQSGIGGVDLLGFRDEEYIIECSPALLKQKEISINDVMNAVRAKNINLPAGEVYKDNKTYLIRVNEELLTEEEIGNIVITANAELKAIRVRDVARVSKGFARPDRLYQANGKKGIQVLIKKSRSGDTIKVSAGVQKLAGQFKTKYPDITLTVFADTAFFVKNRLNVLSSNAFIGLIFVILSLLLFFDFTTSFWTVAGMPVSFCAAIIGANYLGISLNLMSMFGFIIVVGMIVDDAIVIAENIYSKREMGLPPLAAAVEGAKEMAFPVFISVGTTIAAFVPLLFISGVLGAFFSVIPIVVMLTLAASFLECLFVLPGHLYHSKKRGKTKQQGKIFSSFQNLHKRFLTVIFTRPGIACGTIIISCLALTSFFAVKLPLRFFPGRVDELSCSLETLPSSSLIMTDATASEIASKIGSNDGLIKEVLITTGISGESQDASAGDNKAYFRIILNPEKNKNIDITALRSKIVSAAENVKNVHSFSVQPVQTGPPKSKPLSVILFGDNFEDLTKGAGQIAQFIQSMPNTADVSLDFIGGKSELLIGIDDLQTAAAGLTHADIGLSIRNAFDGGIATTLKEESGDIDVRVKYDAVSSATISSLDTHLIQNRLGRKIPFNKVGKVTIGGGIAELRHYNGKRSVTVSANLQNIDHPVHTSAYLNSMLKKQFGKTLETIQGVAVKYAGENEDFGKMAGDLGRAYLIAFAAVCLLLLSLFRYFSRMLIVISAIPLCFTGVCAGLALHNVSISYTVIIGIIALSGVVVNDGIILVDSLNNALSAMKNQTSPNFIEVIIDTASKRLRPIVITTVTTVVGLAPMAYGLGGREEFLEPLGLTIMYGLLFATVINLIFVPVFYYVIEVKLLNRTLIRADANFEF